MLALHHELLYAPPVMPAPYVHGLLGGGGGGGACGFVPVVACMPAEPPSLKSGKARQGKSVASPDGSRARVQHVSHTTEDALLAVSVDHAGRRAAACTAGEGALLDLPVPPRCYAVRPLWPALSKDAAALIA